MVNPEKSRRIIWYETVGFAFLILLSWLNELINLPHLLFRSGKHSNVHEALVETAALIVVWLIVTGFTRRILNRLYYLEGFVSVCAWCRRIGHDDEWIPLENYFDKQFDVKTSHGMCPDCQKNWQAQAAAA